jgi:hypothetical protein
VADLPHHFDVAALLEHYGRGKLLELAAFEGRRLHAGSVRRRPPRDRPSDTQRLG